MDEVDMDGKSSDSGYDEMSVTQRIRLGLLVRNRHRWKGNYGVGLREVG
jgi:hypothetical protein